MHGVGKLTHNASNPITAGIERCTGPDGPFVRKTITGTRAPTHVDWASSTEPRDWRYWRREAHVYEEGLQQVFAPEGLRGPELLGLDDLGDTVVLELEAVDGPSGALPLGVLEDVAERLGAAQGRLARESVDRPWFARGFLADHIASKHVDWGSLDDDACWAHPLVASTWPEGLRAGLRRLASRRQELLRAVEAAPRTLCHLDFWGHNLVHTEAGPVVLDWACVGHGALGEDLSNLVLEAVLDGLLPADELAAAAEVLLAAYLRGTRSSGFLDDEGVRTGFRAAGVKWVWLGPLHLERARTGGHHVYGGGVDPAPTGQYIARGRALAQVVSWTDAVG